MTNRELDSAILSTLAVHEEGMTFEELKEAMSNWQWSLVTRSDVLRTSTMGYRAVIVFWWRIKKSNCGVDTVYGIRD